MRNNKTKIKRTNTEDTEPSAKNGPQRTTEKTKERVLTGLTGFTGLFQRSEVRVQRPGIRNH